MRKLFAAVGREHATLAPVLWRACATTHLRLVTEAERILRDREPLASKDLAVTGKDLIDKLAQPPGPAIGRILAILLSRVIEDPRLNTREQLLELAQHAELEGAR